MICISLAQWPQHNLRTSCSAQCKQRLNICTQLLSSSSHMFHVSPKIFLTIAVVHHCQHFLPYFNSDSSLNATIKHTCPRNTFPTRLTYGSVFPSLPWALFSSASWTKTVLSRPSEFFFYSTATDTGICCSSLLSSCTKGLSTSFSSFFSFLD